MTSKFLSAPRSWGAFSVDAGSSHEIPLPTGEPSSGPLLLLETAISEPPLVVAERWMTAHAGSPDAPSLRSAAWEHGAVLHGPGDVSLYLVADPEVPAAGILLSPSREQLVTATKILRRCGGDSAVLPAPFTATLWSLGKERRFLTRQTFVLRPDKETPLAAQAIMFGDAFPGLLDELLKRFASGDHVIAVLQTPPGCEGKAFAMASRGLWPLDVYCLSGGGGIDEKRAAFSFWLGGPTEERGRKLFVIEDRDSTAFALRFDAHGAVARISIL